jgi:hypothetical protein
MGAYGVFSKHQKKISDFILKTDFLGQFLGEKSIVRIFEA